jgi:polysaccharide chain length determinant protein (PEP-CTERM system associated)
MEAEMNHPLNKNTNQYISNRINESAMGNGNGAWKNVYLIFIAAWRQRYLILVPIIFMPIVGGVIAMTQGKVFDTHTTILVQETSKLNPFLEDLSVSTNLKERMAALDTLVHSRHVLFSVAAELNLIDDETSDSEKFRVIRSIAKGLKLSQEGKDLVKISYRSSHSGNMKGMLEVVSQHFIEQLLAPEKSSIEQSEKFILQQLQYQKKQLLAAEKKLSLFKKKYATDLPAFHGGNIKSLRDIKQLLAKKEVKWSAAKAVLSSMDQQLSSSNPVVAVLENKIVMLTSELAILKSRYTDQHSKVVNVQRQVNRLQIKRNNLLEKTARLTPEEIERLWHLAMNSPNNSTSTSNTENVSSPLLISQLQEIQKSRAQEQGLEQEIISLNKQMAEMKVQVTSFSSIERELTELERELDTKQSLYNDFLKRYEMAKITGALGAFEEKNRIKIIDEPYTPMWPSNIPSIVFILAGLIGGIVFGSGMAVIVEVMDTSVRRIDQLQFYTQSPLLSRIPKFKDLLDTDTIFEDS